MKNYFFYLLSIQVSLIIFISGTPFKAGAQNYNFIYPGTSFQYTTPGVSVAPPFNNVFNMHAWSQIKESTIDSSDISGSDMIYYPFRTWKDTSTILLNLDTGLLPGPSWMGLSITESVLGLSLFFNEQGDSIKFIRFANPGQSWTLMNIDTSGTIVATVDSVVFRVVLSGWADSIKFIHLNVYDSINVEVSTHPANNFQLELGKNEGWRKLFSFREFPNTVIPLMRVEDPVRPTERDIYNFDINDEFEYESVYNNSVHNYYYTKILNKFFNANGDSVSYIRYNILNSYSQFQPPYFASGIDTISYPSRIIQFYERSPEQTNTPMHTNYPLLNCYTISAEPARFNKRTVFHETYDYNFIDTSHNLILFQHFEADFSARDYSPGLGLTYKAEYRRQLLDYTDYYMTWYRKGAETWGTYAALITDLDEHKNEFDIKIYPQPAFNFVSIYTKENNFSSILVYDITGQLLSTQNITGDLTNLSLFDFPEGVLIISLEGKNYKARKRIIHSGIEN